MSDRGKEREKGGKGRQGERETKKEREREGKKKRTFILKVVSWRKDQSSRTS